MRVTVPEVASDPLSCHWYDKFCDSVDVAVILYVAVSPTNAWSSVGWFAISIKGLTVTIPTVESWGSFHAWPVW